jgi:hypothetical protein
MPFDLDFVVKGINFLLSGLQGVEPPVGNVQFKAQKSPADYDELMKEHDVVNPKARYEFQN